MSMSCSTWMMALTPIRAAAFTSTSMIACLSPVLTPLVGSSSRMTSGCSANALATSSSFLSPWGSVRAGRSSAPPSPNTRGDRRDLVPRRRSPARPANSRARRPRRDVIATASVSPTLSAGNMWTSWNARAMPARASRTGPRPATSSPLKRTAPLVGDVSPLSTFTSVVFPAPLGPTIDTNSPGPTARLTPSSAQKVP